MIRDQKYNIGLSLMILSFTLSVFSYYMLVFAWIPFLIGVVLVILSSHNWKTKLVTVTTPILIFIPAATLFLTIYNYSSPKVYLVPKDYEGTLRIVYDEQCGQKIKYHDGKRTIQFPKDGILVFNEDFDGGTNNKDEYYYVDVNGRKYKTTRIKLKGSGAMSADHPNATDFHFVDLSSDLIPKKYFQKHDLTRSQ